MFHNDIRFATVYCSIFLILSNQMLQYIGICIRMSVLLPRLQMIPYLLSPRITKLWRGYRVCPISMYVSKYVCLFVRMFTFCHRSSDHIYYPISILLHTNIGYDNTSNKFAFQRDRVKVKVAVTIFRKTLSSL